MQQGRLKKNDGYNLIFLAKGYKKVRMRLIPILIILKKLR